MNLKQESYPLLESIPEYQEVLRLEQQISAQINEYRKALGELLHKISSWHWNDPVTTVYREIFGPGVVVDEAISGEDLLSDLETRWANKIPPGYKDSEKDDRGVGDLLIWHSILELGQTRGAHVIFVSGDEKADWWHQSDKKPLFPRFELIEEFRRHSGGKSFFMISFARLLDLFGATNAVVQEVEQGEAAANLEHTLRALHADFMNRAVAAERAVFRWLITISLPDAVSVSTYPGADFFVRSAAGPVAYKVKYFPRLRKITPMEEERPGALGRFSVAAVFIVFVAENEEILGRISRMMSRRPLIPGYGRIFGFLDERGEFLEVSRLGPPD